MVKDDHLINQVFSPSLLSLVMFLVLKASKLTSVYLLIYFFGISKFRHEGRSLEFRENSVFSGYR